jgi:hypothetical protein
MTDKNNSPDGGEEIKPFEKISEQITESNFETATVQEKKEILSEDKIISEELKREIELMEADETTQEDAKKKAKEIEFLGEKEKVEHLLQVAKEKGVVAAIQTAKRTNEPYLLDLLHDILAREGYYQQFIK